MAFRDECFRVPFADIPVSGRARVRGVSCSAAAGSRLSGFPCDALDDVGCGRSVHIVQLISRLEAVLHRQKSDGMSVRRFVRDGCRRVLDRKSGLSAVPAAGGVRFGFVRDFSVSETLLPSLGEKAFQAYPRIPVAVYLFRGRLLRGRRLVVSRDVRSFCKVDSLYPRPVGCLTS